MPFLVSRLVVYTYNIIKNFESIFHNCKDKNIDIILNPLQAKLVLKFQNKLNIFVFNTWQYEGRSYYPPPSNHLDYQAPYEGARYHGQAHGHGREAPRGETIDGWSVQVGTQLRVHDDGRSRNPGQFYVHDEKPHSVRRYPHQTYDYIRN